jgi:hypothetical protein
MILQALYELYKKLADDHANGLPMPGYSLQRISFKVGAPSRWALA